MRLFRLITAAALAAMTLLSCVNKKAEEALSLAERMMEDAPDSSLMVLESIDTAALGSKAQRARYSLLYSMALDKNYIDTTDTRLIMPAVRYYSRHGSPDEKMTALYYLGRVQYNAGDDKSSVISLTEAKDLFPLVENKRMCGLIDGALADIYSDYHLAEEQLNALKEGLDYFKATDDERRCNLMVGRLASAYHDLHLWAKADSLYKEALNKNVRDTFAMRVFLSNYAIMKMIQPAPDYEGAIGLFLCLTNDYKKNLEPQELYCYAFAQELSGNRSACDEILSREGEIDEYWRYRILQHRKNYKEAIDYLNETYVVHDSIVRTTLKNSIYDSLKNYYEKESDAAEQKVLLGKLWLAIAILTSLILLSIITSVLCIKIKSERNERKRIESLLENTSALLMDSEDERQRTLSTLHDSYAKLYRDQFFAIKSLCTLYLSTRMLDSKKDKIYSEVESILSFIKTDHKKWKPFESRINKNLDNIVAKLRQEIPDLNEADVKLFCYSIIKLDAETISTITGLSTSNIYSRKSRLKEKIISINPAHKAEFLLFF